MSESVISESVLCSFQNSWSHWTSFQHAYYRVPCLHLHWIDFEFHYQVSPRRRVLFWVIVFPLPLSPLAVSSKIEIYIWISTSLSVLKSSTELNWIKWPNFLNSVYFPHDLSIQDLFSISLPVPYFPSLTLVVFLLGQRTTHIQKAIISNVTGSYGNIRVVRIHVSRHCFFFSHYHHTVFMHLFTVSVLEN